MVLVPTEPAGAVSTLLPLLGTLLATSPATSFALVALLLATILLLPTLGRLALTFQLPDQLL